MSPVYLTALDATDRTLLMNSDTGLFFGDLELSPDGKRAAITVPEPPTGTSDVWIYDVARGLRTRLTFDPASDDRPVWSPDGSRIVFASNRKGNYDP